MRMEDPIYEDACTGSPSLICSGTSVRGSMLHLPDPEKKIAEGDAVHWDICLRYDGYPIDTSRTRVVGKATDEQKHAYEVSLRMHEAVLKAAKPGVKAKDLVVLADKVAREGGFELWDAFLGHGLGMDTHERPDLVVEETKLAENMVLAIEPRVLLNDRNLFGNEDMVLVTHEGGLPLTQFPKNPLEIEI
jgi:Xaa-Pro aminopeptidase